MAENATRCVELLARLNLVLTAARNRGSLAAATCVNFRGTSKKEWNAATESYAGNDAGNQ
jgi:hypothetical protein